MTPNMLDLTQPSHLPLPTNYESPKLGAVHKLRIPPLYLSEVHRRTVYVLKLHRGFLEGFHTARQL